MAQVTGKIKKIAGKSIGKNNDKKGFLLEGDDNWFTAIGTAVADLDKCKEEEEIVVDYDKKGVYRNVTKISKITAKKEEPNPLIQDVPKFTCETCGIALKDDKYKKCYTCNRKSGTSGKETKPQKEKSNFTSGAKDVQIQRGNSLNSASAVLKGNFEGTNTDIETIKQATLNLAETFLQWLKLE